MLSAMSWRRPIPSRFDRCHAASQHAAARTISSRAASGSSSALREVPRGGTPHNRRCARLHGTAAAEERQPTRSPLRPRFRQPHVMTSTIPCTTNLGNLLSLRRMSRAMSMRGRQCVCQTIVLVHRCRDDRRVALCVHLAREVGESLPSTRSRVGAKCRLRGRRTTLTRVASLRDLSRKRERCTMTALLFGCGPQAALCVLVEGFVAYSG